MRYCLNLSILCAARSVFFKDRAVFFIKPRDCVADIQTGTSHKCILVHIEAAVMVGDHRVRQIRIAGAEIRIRARLIQLKLGKIIAAERQLTICDNVSFSEQLVHDLRRFSANLRVVDERGGKVRPLDLRRAAIQRRNALRGLTDLCTDAVAALLRNGARCAPPFQQMLPRRCRSCLRSACRYR